MVRFDIIWFVDCFVFPPFDVDLADFAVLLKSLDVSGLVGMM